jgi:hypothetical protein
MLLPPAGAPADWAYALLINPFIVIASVLLSLLAGT